MKEDDSTSFFFKYGWAILIAFVVIAVIFIYYDPSISSDPYALFEINQKTLDSVCKNVTNNLNSTFMESNTNSFFCKLNNETLKVVRE
jgi:hypothetical protein